MRKRHRRISRTRKGLRIAGLTLLVASFVFREDLTELTARDAHILSNESGLIVTADMSGTERQAINNARNAIAHAHTSAEFTVKYGETVAEFLGNFKEITSPDPKDSYKDQYNNQAGRQIGRAVNNMDLTWKESWDAIDDMVIDAFNNNELIINSDTDPRVPDNLDKPQSSVVSSRPDVYTT